MPESKHLLKVFLCHATQDKPVVRKLYQNLVAEEWIDTWLDEKKLLPGQDWRLNIEEAVETSDIVIVCLSSNSVNKEGFVKKELRYAREISLEKPDGSIFLIPLRLDECEVPRGLRFFQWADYFGKKEKETYKDLLKSLKLRYEQVVKREENARREKERLELQSVKAEEFIQSKEVDIVPSLNRVNRIDIALWGASGSGKSTFLATLYNPRRWSFHNSDNVIARPYGSTLDTIIEEHNQLMQGYYLKGTALTTINSYEMSFDHEKNYVFNILDTRGEFYKESIQSLKTRDERAYAIWDFLFSSKVIICLIDPTRIEYSLELLSRLTENISIKQKQRMTQFVAVCFSKIDVAEYFPYRDNPSGLIENIAKQTGVNIKATLAPYFMPDRLRYFCVSALGVDEKGKSIVKEDGTLMPNQINPINTLESINWIVNSIFHIQ